MRCYKVKAVGPNGVMAVRYAGTNAEARSTREHLMDLTGLAKKHVTIDEDNIPAPKTEQLEFINAILAKQDASR